MTGGVHGSQTLTDQMLLSDAEIEGSLDQMLLSDAKIEGSLDQMLLSDAIMTQNSLMTHHPSELNFPQTKLKTHNSTALHHRQMRRCENPPSPHDDACFFKTDG